MSAPREVRAIFSDSPFSTFNTPEDTQVGAEEFFQDPKNFTFALPPYRLTNADVAPTPGGPFLTVFPGERGPSTLKHTPETSPSIYFLMHPAIYRLMPFVRVPAHIQRTDPGYLATIIDRAVPVFETVHRTHPHVQHTRTLMILLANINRFVLAVKALVPHRARDEWFAFVPPGGSATSSRWDTYPPLFANWLFPGTEEFLDDQPLHDALSAADHATLLRIASPTLRTLLSFLARAKVNNPWDTDRAVHLLNEAIDPRITVFQTVADEFRAGRLSPAISQRFFNTVRALINFLPPERRNDAWTHDFLPEDPDFVNLFLTASIAIPRAPHEDTLEDPYPIKDMSSFDPIWYWWRRLQEEHRPHGEGASPHPTSDPGSRAGTYSPHYVPTTPPSPSPAPSPATPPAQMGNSAVGSASFDIRQLLRSTGRDTPTPRKASAIAASPPESIEMHVDSPEMSSADAIAIAEALDDLPPRRGPPRTAARGRQAPRRGAPPVHPALASDKKGRPMIKIKSSQKSVTPPASEAYNEEGEEEKDEEEEEEEEEAPPCPAKRRRTAPALPKSKTPGKSKGKGKAQVETPALPDLSTTFPIPVRKTRGKSKKAELPAYVPPQPVPLMDTVSLAAETLASQRREPLVFDAGCANCILRDRECDHGALRSLCEHCEKGRLSHCTHNFSVVDHARAANHLEPYTRLSNECGNELITDLSAACADYELTREQLFRASARIAVASNRVSTWIRRVVTNLGVYGLPRIMEIPAALRPLWGQLLEDAEVDLSVDYRAAIQRYPFISDPRRADLPSDDDLPTLIEFLTRRAARAHQPTPPLEEESN
ncbi:hypothetical protein DFH08DRAFT_993807 [Mycena albidolilacea]|uniref:Uncharacterized protein n=1 Tax=Mycena albidolilacea TaxID=1033008 RepID=A0AAD7E6W3_9AGAR|nr:hypothetical protein DFH08DRAFT_993807 [Mycena albidolilacea]